MQALKEVGFKVIVCGESGVGKTQFVSGWINPNYEFQYEGNATIGADFSNKSWSVGSQSEINLQIWDIAGQDRYASLESMYLRNAGIGIFIFNVSDAQTLRKLQYRIERARAHMLPDAPCILVGNKLDRADKYGKVSESDIDAFVRENNMALYHEVSAQTRVGLDEFDSKIFEIAEQIRATMSTNDDRESNGDDDEDPIRSQLLRDLNEFISEHRNNPRSGTDRIEAIVSLLKHGLEAEYPQQFFDSNLDGIKQHLTALQWTSRSMLNTVVNMVLTVLAALTVVGLPLMYCMGLWRPNAVNGNSLQHSFRFFSFGDKQLLQMVCEDVAHDLDVSLSF